MDVEPQVYERTSGNQKISAQKLIETISAQNKEFDIIVDIGCGNGWTTELLAKNITHKRIIGVDIDPNMISFSKQKNTIKTIDYLIQDMSVSWNELSPQLKQLESKVSLIFSHLALHWIQNKNQLFEILSKLLSKNGLVIAKFVLIPDISPKLNEEQRELLNGLSVDQQIDVWKESLTNNEFTIEGFEITKTVWPMNKADMIDFFPIIVSMYRSYFFNKDQFGTKSKLLKDVIFDVWTNPNAYKRYPNAWKNFIAGEIAENLDFIAKTVNLWAIKWESHE